MTTPRDTYHLTIPAPGEHMAYSASMAVPSGSSWASATAEIIRGVAAYQPAGSRMRVIRLPEERLILDDCYNANPQSVTAALEILAKTECDRKVAVLGDMGELGDLTAQAHYNMGALAAMLGIDFVAGHRRQGRQDRRRRRPERRRRHCILPPRRRRIHELAGQLGTQYRHAGQGVPRHALWLDRGAAETSAYD